MSESTKTTSTSFPDDFNCLEEIARRIRTRDDLKDILIRVNTLQRAIFDEIQRRKNQDAAIVR